jgi:hypothetical protein
VQAGRVAFVAEGTKRAVMFAISLGVAVPGCGAKAENETNSDAVDAAVLATSASMPSSSVAPSLSVSNNTLPTAATSAASSTIPTTVDVSQGGGPSVGTVSSNDIYTSFPVYGATPYFDPCAQAELCPPQEIVDAGSDAGTPDAGIVEAGIVEAGVVDEGGLDAGVAIDAAAGGAGGTGSAATGGGGAANGGGVNRGDAAGATETSVPVYGAPPSFN